MVVTPPQTNGTEAFKIHLLKLSTFLFFILYDFESVKLERLDPKKPHPNTDQNY